MKNLMKSFNALITFTSDTISGLLTTLLEYKLYQSICCHVLHFRKCKCDSEYC